MLGTTSSDGTEPGSMARVARSFGLKAFVLKNMTVRDLREALRLGETVILDLQAWKDPDSKLDWSKDWSDGHYVVLVGMDAEFAYFMDPWYGINYVYLPLSELTERWHDVYDRTSHSRRYFGLGIMIDGASSHPTEPAALIHMD